MAFIYFIGKVEVLPTLNSTLTALILFAATPVVAGCEWVRPNILAEGDRVTTEAKNALLAHNLKVVGSNPTPATK